MNHLYHSLILLYAVAIKVVALFKPKARLFVEGRKNLLTTIQSNLALEIRPIIWMHCSSLGEFEQGRPILEQVRQKYPHYALVLTFFSPSGYQVRKKYQGVDYVYYLPLDTPQNARHFVKYLNPQLAIFVKYDLWLNFLTELQTSAVPTILVDAIFRSSQLYFKWYGILQKQMLHCLSWIFVQNESSKSLLQNIHINHASVAGDTRFDRVWQVAQSTTTIEKIESIAAQYNLVIAGSTWAEDESMLREAMLTMTNDWKLLIVPHDVDEERIKSVETTFGLEHTIRWSQWHYHRLDKKVLIVDTIGLLSKLYKHATVAWIGGGLKSKGVHNVLEAAVYGVPCAYGPIHQKYQEAVELIEWGGAKVCHCAADFNELLQLVKVDKGAAQKMGQSAHKYVLSKVGATTKILAYLEEKNWLKML